MEDNQVVLFGKWHGSYCTRVEMALKLKGIPYDYVDVELGNKNELLLQHNPVNKTVPILVHRGRHIHESLVILEYIDEQWNHAPKLLPEDPYQRAKIRFWANFYDHKIKHEAYAILTSKGQDREKAIEMYMKLLDVFATCIQKEFPTNSPLDGENLGLLGIIVGANACNYQAAQEAIGIDINQEMNPAFFSWVNTLKNYPVMRDTLPPHEKLVDQLKEKFF